MSRFVIQLSGGITSWAAGRLIMDRGHYDDTGHMLFADTYMEDADCYRFLIEGAANIAGVACPSWSRTTIPDVDQMMLRKAVLDDLRKKANQEIPGLDWIAEGRDVWQVFNDERMMGNSRADMCSRILKRELLKTWIETNCDPKNTVLVHGLGFDEHERREKFERRYAGWRVASPLFDDPWPTKAMCLMMAHEAGVQPPTMYYDGFPHANCGGFCVKAGQDNFRRLLLKHPARYAYHEGQENAFRAMTGKDVSIMKDRRNKTTTPLTMQRFREEFQATGQCDTTDNASGCGCAMD